MILRRCKRGDEKKGVIHTSCRFPMGRYFLKIYILIVTNGVLTYKKSPSSGAFLTILLLR
jgi:hypothetical protein